MYRKVIGWVLLLVLIVCIVWLVFSSFMVSKAVFPSGRYLITASEGAALRVENDGVVILPGNSGSTDLTSFNPILKPLMAGPVMPVFIMSIYGCVCLINKPRTAG